MKTMLSRGGGDFCTQEKSDSWRRFCVERKDSSDQCAVVGGGSLVCRLGRFVRNGA